MRKFNLKQNPQNLDNEQHSNVYNLIKEIDEQVTYRSDLTFMFANPIDRDMYHIDPI